jgi:hypothetical protein
MTTITSGIVTTHRLRPPPSIEAWQYIGQPYVEYPDWVRSKLESVYLGGKIPKPHMRQWAFRDDEGYFWRWMGDAEFTQKYEALTQ